jgi:hypothetical protein
MADDYESALEEKPQEFLTSIANGGGTCDGQAILPAGDHFICSCTCGEWEIETSSQAEGLRLARIHTGSLPG